MRKRILKEATRLFGQNGFEGTSLQAIADGVGIRKPSLLYHFASKAILRQEVIQELMNHWKEELPRLLTAASSGHDRFANTVTALVTFFMEDINRAHLILREILDRPAEASLFIEKQLTPWINLVADYIRMGQKSGLIRPEVQPESFITQVLMMVIGTVATGRVVSAIMTSGSGGALDSNIGELVRIARDSLFINPENTEVQP